jgi:hypothetical protein
MTDSADDAVTAGRSAWERIHEHGRKCFEDWLQVAKALAVGRSQAMQEAKCNKPVGTGYVRVFSVWKRDRGFSDITPQETYRALQVLEHISEIQQWRDSLPEAQRLRMNSPSACYFAWRRAIKPATSQRRHIEQRVVAAGEAARRGRPVYWPGEFLKRAHRAVLDSRSTDLLTICRLALEAAIRSESDLLALLPEPPTAVRRSAEKDAAQPAEAHA